MHKFSAKNLGRSMGCGKLLVTAGHEQSKGVTLWSLFLSPQVAQFDFEFGTIQNFSEILM